jgi:hypothetical protein
MFVKKNQPWKKLAIDFHYNLQEFKTFQGLDHIPRLPNAHHPIAQMEFPKVAYHHTAQIIQTKFKLAMYNPLESLI